MGSSLTGYQVFVLGAVDDVGRVVAVALAEAGATISVTSATDNPAEEFVANSILNEAWSMGRAGAFFASDAGHREELRSAIELKADTLLIAMQSVREKSWALQLAQDAGRPLIAVDGDGADFRLWVGSNETMVTATTATLAEAVVALAGTKD
ncbi:MAG TPA: hypothetical protein VFO84_07165 [Dehalococcoidia bacterium]|nr:hypothetical protein [Dehalococcoidia bacterium]